MKNNKFSLLLTLTFLLCNPFCSYGASPTSSSATVEKRLEKIEGILKSNAFAYDINLSAKVAEAISQQNMLLRELDSIENRLLALESRSTPVPRVDGISKVELDKELARLKKEYDTLFKTATDFNEKALKNLKEINDSNDSNSKKAIETANNFVTWVLTVITIFISLVGGGGFAIWKALTKKVNDVRDAAKAIEETADDAEDKATQNLDDMKKVKDEIRVLQEYIDFKQNFSILFKDNFKPIYKCKRLIADSEALFDRLKELPDSEENEANKSYAASVSGVLSFMIERYHDAYKYFEVAMKHNVHDRSDRYLNFASSAAKIYVMSERLEKSYFRDALNIVIRWIDDPERLEELKKDPEIAAIWDEIQEELDKL